MRVSYSFYTLISKGNWEGISNFLGTFIIKCLDDKLWLSIKYIFF